jgi:hypothetical protein
MIIYTFFPNQFKKLAPNVPAVYEIGGGIRGRFEAKPAYAAANLPE